MAAHNNNRPCLSVGHLERCRIPIGGRGEYQRATTVTRGNTTSSQGRIVVAMVSVLLGIPLHGLYLFETQFNRALFYMTVFQLVATWAPPGTFLLLLYSCVLLFFRLSTHFYHFYHLIAYPDHTKRALHYISFI